MLGSLFAGVSGLNANSVAMSVIGDNIANVNTTGFKSNRPTFANILSQSLEGSTSNSGIGRGVFFAGQSPSWSQGFLETTTNPTDLAINGRGFFMVKGESGSTYYTRAGEFKFDKDGNLVNPDSLIVQGFEIDSSGALGTMTKISVPSGSSAPRPSDLLTTNLNLNGSASAGDTYSTTLTVYDSLGATIPLTVDFTYNGTAWDWAASVPASAGTCSSTGTIAFDSAGALDPAACSPASANPTFAVTGLTNGAADVNVEWSYLDASGATNGSVTGYASPSTVTFTNQNGYPAGALQSVSVSADGTVMGAYSNGQQTPLFKIALADFPSYWGLAKMGENLYSESINSGQPMPGTPGSGRLGSISPSSLEMSNVDLASEFVKLITTQRAFQANSKVISTSDEILETLINIKR